MSSWCRCIVSFWGGESPPIRFCFLPPTASSVEFSKPRREDENHLTAKLENRRKIKTICGYSGAAAHRSLREGEEKHFQHHGQVRVRPDWGPQGSFLVWPHSRRIPSNTTRQPLQKDKQILKSRARVESEESDRRSSRRGRRRTTRCARRGKLG